MRRVSGQAAGLVVAVLSGLALAVSSTTAQAATDGPDVIAHRGSSGMAPENTAAAIDLAVR
ncbi:hydrolase, partial [Streptomyces sp. SID6013]|nr:hydrolase [Streptomyces sp. SID6013]